MQNTLSNLPRSFSLVLSMVLFLILLSREADAQWRGEHRIDGAGYASSLSMKVSGNNHYVLFHTFINPNWTTYLAVSRDGGRSPWTRQAISHRKWPRFDAEGDVVVIAEGEQGPGGGHGGGQPEPDHFWVEVSHDAGQTYFQTQLNTSTLFDLWGYPAVKITGNRVYLHWSEDGGVQYLQISDDAGISWLIDPIEIPVRLIHEMLEAEGDNLHSLLIQDLLDDDQLTYQRSVDAGQTWTSQRIDNDDAGTHGITKAVIRVDGNRVSAVWDESYEWNQRDLFFSTSIDNGNTWSRPERINDIVIPKEAVVVGFDFAADDENMLVAYTQRVPFGNNVVDCYARYSTSGGALWSASKRVNDIPSSLGYPMSAPHCGITGDRAVVTWLDPMVSIPDDYLMAAHTTDNGQTWINRQVSSGPVWELNEYALDYDDEGAVGVSYERTTGHAYANALHQPYMGTLNDLEPGNLFSIEIHNAGLSDEGGTALVVLSGTGSGSLSGGIAIPNSGGRSLLLDYDPATLIGLSDLLPLLVTSPITSGSASTPAFTVPQDAIIGDLWAAAVVMLPQGGYGSLTDTLKIH